MDSRHLKYNFFKVKSEFALKKKYYVNFKKIKKVKMN